MVSQQSDSYLYNQSDNILNLTIRFQTLLTEKLYSLCLLLPCLWSGLQPACGSHVHCWCRSTGRPPAPPPAPEQRGGTAEVPGPGASAPGHSRGKSRCRCPAAEACTSDLTWTWLGETVPLCEVYQSVSQSVSPYSYVSKPSCGACRREVRTGSRGGTLAVSWSSRLDENTAQSVGL